MTILYPLPGAAKLLDNSNSIDHEAVEGDQELEIECYNAVLEAEQSMTPEHFSSLTLETDTPSCSKKVREGEKIDLQKVYELVKEKSRDVVVAHTQQEYAR